MFKKLYAELLSWALIENKETRIRLTPIKYFICNLKTEALCIWLNKPFTGYILKTEKELEYYLFRRLNTKMTA